MDNTLGSVSVWRLISVSLVSDGLVPSPKEVSEAGLVRSQEIVLMSTTSRLLDKIRTFTHAV